MKVSYKELNQKVSGDLRGLSVSRNAQGQVVLAHNSTFSEIPAGSKVRLKSMSFSKLEFGDFVMVSNGEEMVVRRFLRLDLTRGTTRLIVMDDKKQEESLPFTRLVGLIDCVRRGDQKVNPNPQTFLHRLALRLTHKIK